MRELFIEINLCVNHLTIVMGNYFHTAFVRFCAFCILALLFGAVSAQSQVIILPEKPTLLEKSAATTLQEELYKISDEMLPIVSEADAPKGRKEPFRFYIGATREAASAHSGEWSVDEILIHNIKGGMVLTGHPTRGPLYAVNTLIEEGYGVRWWTSTEANYPSRAILPVPELVKSYSPPLKYREASISEMMDRVIDKYCN